MSAMRICKSFKGVLLVSGIISVIGATLGVLISILLGTPIGATIAAMDILIFAVFSLIGTKK
jgi:zinc transport system permease protein